MDSPLSNVSNMSLNNTNDESFSVPSHSSLTLDSLLQTPQQPTFVAPSQISTPPRMKLSIPSNSYPTVPNSTPTDLFMNQGLFMNPQMLFPAMQTPLQITFSEAEIMNAQFESLSSPLNSAMTPATSLAFNFMDQLIMKDSISPRSLKSPSQEYYQFPTLPSLENGLVTPPQEYHLSPSEHPLKIQTTNEYDFEESIESPPSSPSKSPKSVREVKFDPVTGKKQKKMRFRATEAELTFLLSVFEANPFPSTRQRIQLAEKLNLDPKQILFWFQNRRATLKSNGILAVKPKKAQNGASSLAFRGKSNCTLSPLSADNPFFYVAEKKEDTFASD